MRPGTAASGGQLLTAKPAPPSAAVRSPRSAAMILYFAPGACSLADHIVLLEAGLPFSGVKVDLKTHRTEDGRDFTEINPKGYVPALELDGGEMLTENIAILSWAADRAPALTPKGELGRYRLLEALAYISSEVHKAFKPFFDPSAGEADKAKAGAQIGKRLGFLAGRLQGDYLLGDFSAADAYLFVMLTWAEKQRLALADPLPAYAARMKARAAVRQALAEEGLG
jgi:glutathione S-transferase